MANLVSPGVSVTITDESFFLPANATTTPLFFIATADEKTQPDGVTPADGTYEHGVVRTITTVKQSLETYGVPRFLEDPGTGAQYHGDARNEYGLLALNQFLGIGNRAYVVRANVNLNDDFTDIQAMWDRKILEARVVLENLINEFINEYNFTNGLVPSDPTYKQTVTGSELLSLVDTATADLFNSYSFTNVESDYKDDHTASPLNVYANGFQNAPTGTYDGLTPIAQNIGSYPGYPGGGTVSGEFTAQEGGDLLVATADDLKYTREFWTKTSLGANDAARRTAIVTALQAAINSNLDVRSDTFDYDLIVCPGYPEVADELLALNADIRNEALVLSDTPVDRDVDGITNPATGWAGTSARQRSTDIAYYYPWVRTSNIDGTEVVGAATGAALRVIAASDRSTAIWFPPAGLRRGIVTGISGVGYVSGQLGGPTEFVEVNISDGQKDALYQYAPTGDINPIMFIPGSGFVVMGQKTSAPAAGAMDRINVSRLIKYTARSLRRNTLVFVFEPNDAITRDNLKAFVDNFLSSLVAKRAYYDFATLCDETNNTPDRIDRNELYIDVAVKPVKAAEFLYIPIRIVSTGASI